MIIRLFEVPATGRDYDGEEPLEIIDVGEAESVRVLDPIVYHLNAVRVPGSLVVTGELATRAEFHCVRCDEAFIGSLRDPAFSSAWELTGDGMQWIGRLDDDPPEPPEKGQVLPPLGRGETRDAVDLTDDIREAIILAFSGYPVCKPDCKGLCPSCGVNLNKQACRCAPSQDNRWASLNKLDAQ